MTRAELAALVEACSADGYYPPGAMTACCRTWAGVDRDAEAYAYEHEDGTVERCPVVRCLGCGRELTGDGDWLAEEAP